MLCWRHRLDLDVYKNTSAVCACRRLAWRSLAEPGEYDA